MEPRDKVPENEKLKSYGFAKQFGEIKSFVNVFVDPVNYNSHVSAFLKIKEDEIFIRNESLKTLDLKNKTICMYSTNRNKCTHKISFYDEDFITVHIEEFKYKVKINADDFIECLKFLRNIAFN